MLSIILVCIVAIFFYGISIWQYRNPTKASQLRSKSTSTEEPEIDEAQVRRSLIIRGIIFTLFFIVIIIIRLAY